MMEGVYVCAGVGVVCGKDVIPGRHTCFIRPCMVHTIGFYFIVIHFIFKCNKTPGQNTKTLKHFEMLNSLLYCAK